MILTSSEIPFRHHGLYSYRIEIDLTHPENIRQRHVWTAEDGQVCIEDWIRLECVLRTEAPGDGKDLS